MTTKRTSRRTFIHDTSLIVAGSAAGLFTGNGCTYIRGQGRHPSNVPRYNPKKEGGCAVALGYDVDMPPGGEEYLYDRSIGWLYTDEEVAHGHLTDDIRDYINRLGSIAESFDAQLQFFIQGNTFEKPIDVAFWKEFAKRGHALDSHSYYHQGLDGLSPDEVKSQLTRTKRLIETELGQENIGIRGPGGYRNGLRGLEETQQAILDVGIKWVSTQFKWGTPGDDQSWINLVPEQQPYYYPTGLLEIPFCGHQDRSYFDVDMRGSPRPVDEWIAYLKGCVDIACERNLFLSLTAHPSTSFKHDPQARYVKELLAYCRKKPGVVFCTYRDMHRWIAADKTSIA